MSTRGFTDRVTVLLVILVITTATATVCSAQELQSDQFRPYLWSGFNILLHNGIYGSTVPARPDGGEYNPNGGDPYTGIGFGVNIDYRLAKMIGIHFDINTYRRTTPVAYKNGYATSDWVWEMNDYSQRLVGPFSEDVNYSINATGMRLGIKAYPVKVKKLEPWIGVYYGYYTYTLGIFSADNKSTYGNYSGSATGLMYLNLGVDIWDNAESFGATLFFEGGAPVAVNYKIENCLVTGWTFQDYGEGTHIFGYYRLGLSLNFVSRKKL